MNTSSQPSSGALPPESLRPAPATRAQTEQAFAAYGAVLPVPLGSTSAAQQAEAAVTPDVPEHLAARVEEQAGVSPAPERAEAIAAAAYRLGVDDTRADLAQTGDEETLAWYRLRRRALALLCEGRPDNHMLTVREVLTAADGRTPTDAPLSLTWNGEVDIPSPGSSERRAVVHCTTAHGGLADLVVPDGERLALASLLDAETRDVTAPCVTSKACGTAAGLDPSDPMLSGWARLQIAGIDGGALWYCTPHCVSNALARAGAELAAADDQAVVGGGL